MKKLTEFIKNLGPAAIAFSGGVDSSLVALAASRAHGERALAVTVSSELMSEAELDQAGRLARSIGIRHEVVRISVLSVEGLPDNPPERCYLCKMEVLRAIAGAARGQDLGVMLDGTNADDAGSYRPGLKALRELGVVSPLKELGLGKSRVRGLARKAGLSNWDAPSRPCLATRFPYGDRLEREKIERVRLAEEYVASLGFTVFRVRDHGGLARIELPPEEFGMVFSGGLYKKIVAKLGRLGYNYVTLDLEGFRSGSMDAGLKK